MTEPTRNALHALAHELVTQDVTCSRQATQDLARGYLALEAEVERLRAKAAVVDAINAGEVEQMSGWGNADGPTKFGVRLRNTDAMAFGFGPTLDAAYAAATREGTDA